jgi:hypothetical protein
MQVIISKMARRALQATFAALLLMGAIPVIVHELLTALRPREARP